MIGVDALPTALAGLPTDPTDPASYSLIPVNAWSHNYSDVARAARLLEAQGGFEVVSPAELVRRLTANAPHKETCPLPRGPWRHGCIDCDIAGRGSCLMRCSSCGGVAMSCDLRVCNEGLTRNASHILCPDGRICPGAEGATAQATAGHARPPPAPPVSAQRSFFDVLWNAPSGGCQTGCGVNLTARALGAYRIAANPSDSFNGSVVTILYASGLWPLLDAKMNATPCWGGRRPCSWQPWGDISPAQNGGVPQAADANLSAHTYALSRAVELEMPEVAFDGVVIVDFEAWRPLYSENYDGLSAYSEYSRRLIRRAHPQWSATAVEHAAERAFDQGARAFFTATIETIRRLRPSARIGFYSEGIDGGSTASGRAHDDRLLWLWQQVDVLAPSIYPQGTNITQHAAAVASVVSEAIRSADLVASRNSLASATPNPIAHRPAVMPYARALVDERGAPSTKPAPISAAMMNATVHTAAGLGVDGLILWGASADYKTCAGCALVRKQLEQAAGPMIRECVIDRDTCAHRHCSAHGRCVDGAAACRCEAGYSGDHCNANALTV